MKGWGGERMGMAVSRRELLVLGGLLGAGGAGMVAIRALRPVGVEVGRTPVTSAVLADPAPTGGNPDGDVTLAVFTDYNCPACRRAHPEMLAAVAADGGVRLLYLDWPIFGPDSEDSARAAIASDAQGLYPQVHSRLMQGGRSDAGAAEAAVEAAGGTVAKLHETLTRDRTRIDGRLTRHAFLAFSLGLQGTPGHLVGTVLVQGAVSERDFGRAIRRARALGE